MYCLAGLGNPGSQYELTRHNAGFLVIDKIAEQHTVPVQKKGFKSLYGEIIIGGHKVLLVKPQTYMNLSGEAIHQAIRYFNIPMENILIIYDDMDIPPGIIRIRLSGSSGGHKGLGSVINTLGSVNLPRLKIGIGRPERDVSVIDYVLTPFSKEERSVIEPALIRGAQAAVSFIIEGSQYVMNHFNQKPGINNQKPD